MIAIVRGFYLTQRHFYAMLLAAWLVHMIVVIGYSLMPKNKIDKIPVHVLNVKLGRGDVDTLHGGGGEALSPKIKVAEPQKKSAVTVPAAPKAVKKNIPQPSQEEAVKSQTAPQESISPAVEQQLPSAAVKPYAMHARPTQYIRADLPGMGGGPGSKSGVSYGNSTNTDAEIMQRYTQQISLWVNRRKSILLAGLQPGMKGNIIVRLRIDRAGNILYFNLDKATGVPSADAAAVEMVKASNPVPPVPRNHPGGNMFEFLISVNYSARE